jgi:hypothetical protein
MSRAIPVAATCLSPQQMAFASSSARALLPTQSHRRRSCRPPSYARHQTAFLSLSPALHHRRYLSYLPQHNPCHSVAIRRGRRTGSTASPAYFFWGAGGSGPPHGGTPPTPFGPSRPLPFTRTLPILTASPFRPPPPANHYPTPPRHCPPVPHPTLPITTASPVLYQSPRPHHPVESTMLIR